MIFLWRFQALTHRCPFESHGRSGHSTVAGHRRNRRGPRISHSMQKVNWSSPNMAILIFYNSQRGNSMEKVMEKIRKVLSQLIVHLPKRPTTVTHRREVQNMAGSSWGCGESLPIQGTPGTKSGIVGPQSSVLKTILIKR